ncbi:MAG: rhodanese-like domain-containing protein [Verrucomicrobiota bacterium]|nr:rhodanese-like domain-containing protein [Verrucomicrobiota bacterium]
MGFSLRDQWESFFNDILWVTKILFLSFAAGLIISLILPGTIGSEVSKIDPAMSEIDIGEFNTLMKTNPPPVIMDARSDLFYQNGHIPNALSYPLKRIDQWKEKFVEEMKKKDSGTIIIVYCSDVNCEDSHDVAEMLSPLVKNRIFLFKEGWQGWVNSRSENQ